SAMRHHAAALRQAGWTVDYIALDDPGNSGSFTGEVGRAIARHDADRIIVSQAGEWRVQGMIDAWQTLFGVPVDVRADDRFL
ncbi:cryptochrome/photolyase family protein, partial [Vibrio parahaemolyticus]